MSGAGHSITTFAPTGDALLDGILMGNGWSGGTLTYAFPTLTADYSYTKETANNFGAVSAAQQDIAKIFLDKDYGNSANDGFSIEGFTLLDVSQGAATSAHIRFAQSDAASPTAYGYYPSTVAQGGDIWFSTNYAGTIFDYRTPQIGNYAGHTLIHELGHAMGLKHGHAATGLFNALPAAYDSLEFTVMTYRTYINGPTSGYTYGINDAPQTFMMLDISALQKLYGANYSVNSGNTTYSWSEASGDTLVDGVVAISPGGNRIFATIWDGGGIDTYDLSNYSTDLTIDLQAGGHSTFSQNQLAQLDGTVGAEVYASGNIYNALLYQGNTASLIENAIGGSGNDSITGNEAVNVLTGNGGSDQLTGLAGNDVLFGGAGVDTLNGGDDNDKLFGGADADTYNGGNGIDVAYFTDSSGVGVDLTNGLNNTGDAIGDTFTSIEKFVMSASGDSFTGDGTANWVSGLAGADTLSGMAGNDVLLGGAGADTLNGGDNNDKLFGGADGDAYNGGNGTDIALFTDSSGVGVDLTNGLNNTGDAIGDTFTSIEKFVMSASGDNFTGDGTANWVNGLAGADILSGMAGNDVLLGGDGGDTLNGGIGRDKIFGNDGNDTLSGGADTDRDLFYFQTNFGADLITDFTIAVDDIVFRGIAGITQFSDLGLSDDGGGNAVVDAGGGNTIVLTGIDFNALGSGDFIIV